MDMYLGNRQLWYSENEHKLVVYSDWGANTMSLDFALKNLHGGCWGHVIHQTQRVQMTLPAPPTPVNPSPLLPIVLVKPPPLIDGLGGHEDA